MKFLGLLTLIILNHESEFEDQSELEDKRNLESTQL